MSRAAGRDIVIVAGGIGLAPLRSVVLTALAEVPVRPDRAAGRRANPGDLLYADELERWRRDGVEVAVTVDYADSSWSGEVGLVTALISLPPAPGNSVAFICGPDIMMRVTPTRSRHWASRRPDTSITGAQHALRCRWCGHCQLGPLLVCRDGPVVGYDQAAALMRVREL